MKRAAVVILLLALAGPASAQDIEQVIVTAPKLNFAITPNAVAHDFVRTYAAPSVLLGTIPRWRVGICPETRGITPQLAEAINQRLRKIAAEVGAPVQPSGCKSNLSVTFTPEPQKLLDNIRAKNADALGYHGAITISHPIQAWYDTGTTDLEGQVVPDREAYVDWEQRGGRFDPGLMVYTSPTPISEVAGMPGRNGLSSEFVTVTIIVDSRATASYQLDSVADYIAMLALSKTDAYDNCQAVPTIANLMVPDCANTPLKLTDSDLAYLHGVYEMDAGASLQVQQNDIASEMAKTLLAGK